jgi:hypothetical protein
MGAAGVVATSVMAVKATPKALKLLEKIKEEKGEDLSKLEIIKTAGPAYIPAIAIGASAIFCIFGANVLNQRQQAAVISAYALLDAACREHKNKVKELLGEETARQVRGAIAKDKYDDSEISVSGEKQLFYEEFYGKFFERTKEEVLLAEYHFNRNFALRGHTSLNEFYEFLDLPPTKAGEKLGWSLEAGGEFYGYFWVDFEHERAEMDDGLECFIITMPFSPTLDYLDY